MNIPNENGENALNIDIPEIISQQTSNDVEIPFNKTYIEFMFAEFLTNIMVIHIMSFVIICFFFGYFSVEKVFYFSFALDPFSFFYFFMERRQSLM
jgi:hypothetical protein